MSATSRAPELGRASYAGWLASLLVILAVLGIGAVLWFWYHPY